ncbi:OmpA family protein [Luteimonas sp. e5]
MKINTSLLAVATTLLLAGCATHVSRDISPDGVAGEVVFPQAEGATLSGGTFPDPNHVRLVKSGVSKDQLYELLGRPHFREGFARVREWDYLFNFREGDVVRVCQFKVIFDRKYLGRSFHWQPEDCKRFALAEAPGIAAEPFLLETDALFAFDRSGIDDMSAEGRARVRDVASQIAAMPAPPHSVEVLAYTDRLGSSAYNLGLSQARAETVRALLIDAGVSPARIRAVGMGSANPVKTCDDGGNRSNLIACLAPNRRVEVRAVGTAP